MRRQGENMQIIPIAPRIHRLRVDRERLPQAPKCLEKWGWHSLQDLTECANRYIRAFYNPAAHAYSWGSKEAFSERGLIKAFVLINGFRLEGLESVSLFFAKPVFSWVNVRLDLHAIDSPPEGDDFERALDSLADFYVPAAWGIKVMQLIERQIVRVENHQQNPKGRLFGVEFGERTRVWLEWSLVRRLD